MSVAAQITPMMAQYRRIKDEIPSDALLLFRLGDFYEMFFEDAQVGAQLLQVSLTKRGVIPMCGIPYHAAGGYISRILKAGRKVAICDQLEDPRPGKLVKRAVTQILSPGAHFDERMLTAERNNFLAAVQIGSGGFGLALVDLTTGDFRATQTDREQLFLSELERLRPAELIFPSEANSLRVLLQSGRLIVNEYEDWTFAPETAEFSLRQHFKVAALDGFGLKDQPLAVGAAGALIHYLAQHLRRDVAHLTGLSFYQSSDFLVMDSATLRNLEVLEPLQPDAPRTASLYGSLNRTTTPMGARRLRDWLSQPLASVDAINKRQAAVEELVRRPDILETLRQHLAEVRDLERLLSRLSTGSGNARDLQALRSGLAQLPGLKQLLQSSPPLSQRRDFSSSDGLFREPEFQHPPKEAERSLLLQELESQLVFLPEIVRAIEQAIVDEPPLALKEGGLIRDGYDSSLDELRLAGREGKDWIAKLQQDEANRTGITSLKVRFNSVFGYFIEVTRANLDRVPPDYIRKQTVANGERFVTPDLKEVEKKILGAQERANQLEYELFLRLREEVIRETSQLQANARALAQLDVLSAFAETARLYDHCRPAVRDDGIIQIEEGRHPVLDQAVTEERFVPNDTQLDPLTQQIVLITGPNMAGKSTYIRQTALLALLAHTGSFLPARSARVDLVDRIFTRIGASDNLVRGQSTFMVEMSETANILNNATQRSLVILDEIGRGTSTFDGLSLAWSIVEFLHNEVGAKTLFATHYHELTELAARLPRVRNFNVAVREWNDQIIFLRKIVEGGTDKSYGIQVARLAGVPRPVLERAKQILCNLEESELTPEGKPRPSARHRAERNKLKDLPPPPQLDLFAT